MKMKQHWTGSLVLISSIVSGTCFAQKNDVRLIDQTPFDRIFLKVAEKGKDKQYDVFLIEGLRRRPVKPGEDEEKLVIRLINQPDQKYQVAWKHIEKVTLFEQLVLAEAERLRDAAEFDEAYEYFQYLLRASPKFPGVQRGLESCFMAEALHWEQKKELTQALVLLNQLYEVNSTYPDLHRALGRITGTLVDRFVEGDDGPAARGLLEELKTKSPQNAMLAGKAEELRAKANQAFQRAKQERQNGKLREAHESTETAYAWWPELEGVVNLRDQLHESYPLLRVGVRNLRPARASVFPNWSAERTRHLLTRRLFEPSLDDKGQWIYKSPLGQVNAKVENIAVTVAPDLKLADEQLQALEKLFPTGTGLQNQSGGLTITPEPASLFAARRMGIELAATEKPWPGTRFRPFSISAARTGEQSFVANSDYAFQVAGQPLEIVEHRFASAIGILRGLVDGKIQAADRIFPWELNLFQNRPGIAIQRYRIPTTTFLLLNAQTDWLQHREMRMAISGGIHRERIVKLDLGADRDDGRPLTAPFPVGNGYDASLANFAYEPRLMIALKSLIERRVGGTMRKLRLAYWPGELSNRAAFAIRDQLQLSGEGVGIELRPLEIGQVPDRDWDLMLMIWPAMDPLATLPQLRPWMRLGGPRIQKQLEKLETATSVSTANDTLKQLHRAIHQELPLIPLWQTNEYFVKQEQLQGPHAAPLTFYDDVGKWRYTK